MSFGTFLLLAVLAIAVWFVLKGQSAASSLSNASSGPVGTIHGPGTYEIEVVGESHYQGQLESLCGGRTEDSAEEYVQAHLVLEDDNPHDALAVRVVIQGETVGYLSRQTARDYRDRLREAGHPHLDGVCKAVIRGGWDRGISDRGYFGVKLDLPTT